MKQVRVVWNYVGMERLLLLSHLRYCFETKGLPASAQLSDPPPSAAAADQNLTTSAVSMSTAAADVVWRRVRPGVEGAIAFHALSPGEQAEAASGEGRGGRERGRTASCGSRGGEGVVRASLKLP